MKDTRDLRDPPKLGEKLLEFRQALPNAPLSVMYDKHEKYLDVDIYPQDESMATVTAREYRAELEAGAAAGDKYAKSRLETL